MSSVLRLIAAFACAPLFGAPELSWPVPAAADRYVRLALDQNLALNRQALDVDIARARLSLANSLRGPRLDVNARYSLADGGRTIDVPSGDLLNPAYRALNELLVAQGRPAMFPTVSNLAIPLLREREQDTRLRLTVPVFNSELAKVSDSRRSNLEATTLQQAALRRDLRLGVLSGYFGFLRCRSAELILVAAVETTTEALRVSRALLANDKVTEDRVLRAEADDLAVQQQLADAVRDREMAQHTFNVLLHRPLDSNVEEPAAAELDALTAVLATRVIPEVGVPSAREELAALRAAGAAAAAAEAAARARTWPTLWFAADGGIQGESYRFGSGANYAQASLVGELNLWDGRHRRSELVVARAERRRVELQLEGTRELIALETRNAISELAAARSALPAAERRVAAAARAFQLVAAREREGLSNQLAFLDARQTHTAARLNLEITRQRLFVAAARVDRALASSSIN
jgi:outer membrane protein